jgi:hypothetical protein
VITVHLIEHASNPFPGRWFEAGRGHFHVRLLFTNVWLMTYWRRG